MYEIIIYKNKDGEDKITEYITELGKKAQTSKEHRVKVKKIIQYLDLLRALTPLIYTHINPYGNFDLNMEERIPIDITIY